MSAVEQATSESRSSVKLVRNASGKVQIEVKRYAETEDPKDIADAATAAQKTFDELCAKYTDGAS